jgi:DNA-directed RNA polymerase
MVDTQGDRLSLFERQLKLETEMQGLGGDAFKKMIDNARQQSRESSTNYGMLMLSRSVDTVAEGIREFVELAGAGRPGRRHSTVKYLANVDPEVCAFLALRGVIAGVSRIRTLQSVAVEVADWVEDEARFRHFEAESPARFRRVHDRVKKVGNYRHKSRVMTLMMNRDGVSWTPWPKRDKVLLGTKLIDIIIAKTGFVETNLRSSGKRTTSVYLQATDKISEWIDRQCARSELLSPMLMPCIVPPRDWTSVINGGYHSNAIPQLKLIKTRNNDYINKLLGQPDALPEVREAVNALQRTAWKVNKPVLDVVDQCWKMNIEVGSMPSRENLELPTKPHNIDTNEEARREWKRKASKVYEFNNKSRSRRLQVAKTLWLGFKFVEEEAIYFPYQVDFRGRIYAVPAFLNPQSVDYAKAMLTFAQGKPLGDAVAAGWLAVHGANTYGFDKVSLEERIEWVEERNEQIAATAEAPLDHLDFWAAADKPFQFLAFCFEWAGFLREGYSYVSSLPIAMDGSNNGLQNFAAMLRDPVSGAAVNLVPTDTPSDIYQKVADVVVKKLEAYTSNIIHTSGPLEEEELMAAWWLQFGVDRKLTKRPVMVLPYGGTLFSCRKYVHERMDERMHKGVACPWPEEKAFAASSFMARLIWDAIGEVVVAARVAMDWLQKAAKIAAADGLPVEWTTPVGFPVIQSYPSVDSRRVKTQLGDSMVRLTVQEDTDKLDKRRQTNGVSPNFVHSMDASHLVLSVLYATDNGITDFAMIHDSYGTLAADAELLGHCLRHAFVDMYRDNDVLAQFRQALRKTVPEEKLQDLPPLPPKGTLDLEQVKDSHFFFA